MPTSFNKRNIISINTLSKEEILHVLKLSSGLKQKPQPDLLSSHIMGSCFFEPSTRTRLSFESAMYRLGGKVIGFSDAKTTSSLKGESLCDSIKVIGQYADVIVIRHPLEGSAKRAAEATDKPVINAGDGTNQHPTQTFLDLLTIQESQNRLDGLHIAMVGDLKNGRTAHSLAQACSHFTPRLYFVTPPGLELPSHICSDLSKKSIKFTFHSRIEDIIPKADILYMTRTQQERFSSEDEYDRVKDSFILTADLLNSEAKENLKILHPLPRNNEIHNSVDSTPYAYYFQQAQNGLFVRQALLGLVLGKLS